MRKMRHRGHEKVDWIFTFSAAAYNLVRARNLLAAGATYGAVRLVPQIRSKRPEAGRHKAAKAPRPPANTDC